MGNQAEKSNVEGAMDDAKGRVKEAVGALTDDQELKHEGKLDRAAGEAKDKVSEAIDQVREGIASLVSQDDEKKDAAK